MKVMHFNTQKERLDYLKGNFEEIVPKKAEPKEIVPKVVEKEAEKAESAPKKAKKSAKKSKKDEKDDNVQAE